MQVTFGWSGSWFDDQTVAENITSSKAQSKQSRMTGDGSSFSSHVARTTSRASATTGCSQISQCRLLVLVLLVGRDRVSVHPAQHPRETVGCTPRTARGSDRR